MRDEGWIHEDRDELRVEGAGRLLVRNVAMSFDRYLPDAVRDRPVFSRPV